MNHNEDKDFLSLVSLNIETDKHIDSVSNFLRTKKPDVICLQEIFEKDFLYFKKELGFFGVFSPMVVWDMKNGVRNTTGVAILSKFEIKNIEKYYYVGDESSMKCFDPRDLNFSATMTRDELVLLDEIEAKVIIFGEVIKDGVSYFISTTHFTWTPDGKANDFQKKDVEKLLAFCEKKKSLILCGDFNAPRGGEIFNKIALKYKDNIPLKYDSSIDPNLHRLKGLKLMVDGLFSTADYLVKDVQLLDGISDHKVIVAEICKESKIEN